MWESIHPEDSPVAISQMELEMLQEEHIIDANNLGAFYKFVNTRLSNRTSVGAIVDG